MNDEEVKQTGNTTTAEAPAPEQPAPTRAPEADGVTEEVKAKMKALEGRPDITDEQMERIEKAVREVLGEDCADIVQVRIARWGCVNPANGESAVNVRGYTTFSEVTPDGSPIVGTLSRCLRETNMKSAFGLRA